MEKAFSTKNLPFLGVEISGANFTESLNRSDLVTLHDYLYHKHLLIIREQNLTEEQLINVSRIFGTPVPALVPTHRLEKYPLITRHTNMTDENNLPMGVIAPEYVFHSDSYFVANPSKVTLLYSLISPEEGGETCFVDMCFAYEMLSDDIKNFISDKRAIYKNAYINQPPVKHPLVRVHPVTKRKSLFVNIHRALGIDNLPEDEALNLLNDLYQHSIKPEFIYKHQWRNGDLLIWNNPTTMHCATSISDTQKRLLHRVLTEGDFPVI